MNNVSLTGRLTREPELRYGGQDNSTAITRFTLAVDDGKDTDFINIKCFGRTAEWAQKWLSKGSRAEVTGKIKTGSYESQRTGGVGGVVRRRNGKRGKGMATKKEKTKEQRIKTEKTRHKGIFKDLDENKRKLVTPLIEKAAFMSVELDDLQAKLEKDGWTSEYQNGQNQWGTKKSPEAETYIALSKNYAAVIKQLTELVPAAKRKTSRLAALREE